MPHPLGKSLPFKSPRDAKKLAMTDAGGLCAREPHTQLDTNKGRAS